MEGLGSRAWNIARLLGSVPGLRLPLQAGTTAQSPFITGLVNASSGKFDFFAEKGGRRGAPGTGGAREGCPRPDLPVVCPVTLMARAGGSRWRARALSWGGRWAEVRTQGCPCPPQ